MANSFTFIGQIFPIKNNEKLKGYESKTFESGWNQRKTLFNVVCGNDRHLVQITGGVPTEKGKVKSDAKIYTFGRATKDEDGNTVKGEKLEIPFKDRNKQSVIDTVAGFKICSIDTEEYGKRYKYEKAVKNYESGEVDSVLLEELGIINEEDAKTKLSESKAKKQEFISSWDFAKAVNDKMDSFGKELWVVSGDVEITYNVEKDIEYKSYVVNKIYRAKPESEPDSTVVLDFFFGEGAIDKSDWEENKVARVSGYQRYYFADKQRGIKGEFAAETNFKIDGNVAEKCEGLIKKMEKDFSPERPFKKITVKLHAVDGAQVEEIKYDDLNDDQKEDIDLGLATLEDYQKTLGASYGDSIRDYIFKEVVLGKNGTVQETDYTEMSKPHAEVSLDDAESIDDLLD